MGSRSIRNWDRTQTWFPDSIHHPGSEDEAATIIRRAAEQGRRVKPIGEVLSWNDVASIPGDALRFDQMAQVLEVDRDQKRVRVQGGARLSTVNDALAGSGLALDNFGSIIGQTAAGYVGTGSHGTGGTTPALAASLVSMRLVDGTGRVRELDAQRDAELFSAARVHLGCLGVVTEMTFQCVEAFQLEEHLELVDFDDVLANLDHIVDANDYVKLWWLPYNDEIQVWRFNKTDRPDTPLSFSERLDSWGVSGVAFAGVMALERWVPPIAPSLNRVVQRLAFQSHTRVGRSDEIIRYAGSIPRHQETEYAIPRDRAADAIDAVRKVVLAADYRVNFPLEVRFVAADDIPMSPTTGRDSCYVGPYVSSSKWAKSYFADFEALISDFSGRPHWGKTFNRTAGELRALYPDYDKFNSLRTRCDPAGVFRNRFVDRVFPPA